MAFYHSRVIRLKITWCGGEPRKQIRQGWTGHRKRRFISAKKGVAELMSHSMHPGLFRTRSRWSNRSVNLYWIWDRRGDEGSLIRGQELICHGNLIVRIGNAGLIPLKNYWTYPVFTFINSNIAYSYNVGHQPKKKKTDHDMMCLSYGSWIRNCRLAGHDRVKFHWTPCKYYNTAFCVAEVW